MVLAVLLPRRRQRRELTIFTRTRAQVVVGGAGREQQTREEDVTHGPRFSTRHAWPDRAPSADLPARRLLDWSGFAGAGVGRHER